MVRFPIKVNRNRTTRIIDQFSTPILAPVMQRRWVIGLLGTLTALQVTLTAMGIRAWPCPLKSTIEVACPGCGLTRAIVLLAQGQWQTSFQLHAFAPVALGVALLLVTGNLLPTRLRCSLVNHLAAFEKRTAMMAWLMVSMLIYWVCRIIFQI